MTFKTEFEFVLPRGYVDQGGILHREGAMRLATALDEIAPLDDPRVRNNEAYLVVILLARVIPRLGTLAEVTPAVIEGLYAADLAFLQDFYRQINELDDRTVTMRCPHCGETFEGAVPFLGES